MEEIEQDPKIKQKAENANQFLEVRISWLIVQSLVINNLKRSHTNQFKYEKPVFQIQLYTLKWPDRCIHILI